MEVRNVELSSRILAIFRLRGHVLINWISRGQLREELDVDDEVLGRELNRMRRKGFIRSQKTRWMGRRWGIPYNNMLGMMEEE